MTDLGPGQRLRAKRLPRLRRRQQAAVVSAMTVVLLCSHESWAQTAWLLPNGEQTFVDANGAPLAGGTACFYIPTTLTAKQTWQDPGQVTPNASPCVTLDAAGRAIIYGSGQYRQRVLDQFGTLQWDQLTNSATGGSGGGGSGGGPTWIGQTAGTANSQTGTTSAITSLVAGTAILLVPGVTNSAGLVFNLNGYGAKNVLDTAGHAMQGNSWTALTGVHQLVYDGTQWVDVGLPGTLNSPVVNGLLTINGNAVITVGSLPAAGTINGLVTTVTGNTTTSISVEGGTLVNGSGGYVLSGTVSCTLNWGSTGLGGLDVGTLASSLWYYPWIVSNGTFTGCIGSLQSAANATFKAGLPGGYSYYARAGANVTDSSSHMMRTTQLGNNAQYVLTAGSNTTVLPVVANGSAGSPGTPTWVAKSISTLVPPIATLGTFTLFGASDGSGATAVMAAPNGNYGAYNTATPGAAPPLVLDAIYGGGGTGTIILAQTATFQLESTSVYYASGQAGATLAVLGWSEAPGSLSGGPSLGNVAYLNIAQSFLKAQRFAPVAISVTSASVFPDFDAGQNFSFTLGSTCPCTVANPLGTPVAGQSGMFSISQDATGSRVIGTWGSLYKFAGAVTPTQSAGASALDLLPYFVTDPTHIVIGGGVSNAH